MSMVEKGYKKFSPKMSEMFMSMVDEKRIDVPATNGKKGGAYCAGVVPGVGPFQLLNFDGTKQDVATLGKCYNDDIHVHIIIHIGRFSSNIILHLLLHSPRKWSWMSRYSSLQARLPTISSASYSG